MDKATLKLLGSIPVEILAAWEANHPAKWGIRHIIRNYKKESVKAMAYQILAPILVGVLIILGPELYLQTSWRTSTIGFAISVVGLFAMVLTIVLMMSFFHDQEWRNYLWSFETDLKKETPLGMKNLLGMSYAAIKEHSQKRLVAAARTVLETEERFGRMRQDKGVSEADLIAAGLNLLNLRSAFSEALLQAAEFGLSDGKPRQYFGAAEKEE